MSTIHHALVLNLHQPAGNLEQLLAASEWQAREILWAVDRIPRALWDYDDVARVHLALSGTLLETLASPSFQERVYGIIRCGDLLWHLQNQKVLSLLATAYYHPVLPLVPSTDWAEQMQRWLGIGRHLFWRTHFPGFWPPEMGFCREMIPVLKKLGFRYVLVDSHHVEPVSPMRWEEVRYRPHTARFGRDEIIVVVRDRELSDAQLAGMDAGWFMWEVHERTKGCDFPPLVTTCTDGDNGGWFRNTSEKGNFWGVFYRPLLDAVRRVETEVRPTFIDDYLDSFGAHGEVRIRSGAWNTGWHHGVGFEQWTGSAAQKDALRRVAESSGAIAAASRCVDLGNGRNPDLDRELSEAAWHLLRSETSCNFYWGEAWLDRCHRDLDAAMWHLSSADRMRGRAA